MNKVIFLTLKNQLIEQANALGYQVIFKAPKLNGFSGHFNQLRKTITIICKADDDRATILLLLAHEVRHAIHQTHGLFADYYRPEHAFFDNLIQFKSGYKMPCLKTAYEAELDCDRWAQEWLTVRNIKYPDLGLYKYKETLAYKIWDEYKKYIKFRISLNKVA